MYQIDFAHPVSVYFIGIGGISMSGLAEILLDEGFRISGSDRAPSPLTELLASRGVQIFYGQKAENITKDLDVIVYTSAIHPDNPEMIAARNYGIPLLTRAELLGQMMKNYQMPVAISGTHGKTTTTSMVSEILLAAALDPTLSIGGILKSIGGNVRIGHSDYFVTEACEYTNSFLSFFPRIGLILNIEEDHLDFFKDLADIRASFHRFALLLPANGALIINGGIENLSEITDGVACPIITFGLTESYDYSACDITYNEKGCASFTLCKKGEPSGRFSLAVPGEHNVLNALAAIALSERLHIDSSVTKEALLSFGGTDRRFEYKGTYKGITIIDDYAHHPTEITATLRAADKYPHKRLICIFQPHTYSRTKAFLKEFAVSLSAADHVILAPIYAARETDTLGISSETLQKEIEKLSTKCDCFPDFSSIESYVKEHGEAGDLLITMGAGNVVTIGEELLQ